VAIKAPVDDLSRLPPRVSTSRFATHGAFVRVEGEFDLAMVDPLRMAVAREVERGHRHIVIDLAEASLLDCACLGAILSEVAPLRSEPDATVLFAGAAGMVERLLTLLDFGQVCDLLPDATSAAELALDPTRPRAEGWRSLPRAPARSSGYSDRTPHGEATEDGSR
jgi:anti-sigma B factor antagonist